MQLIRIVMLLFLLQTLTLSKAFADRELDPGHGVTKEQVLEKAEIAVNALLDPKIPDSIVAEFDYGVRPEPYSIRSTRNEGKLKMDPAALPEGVETFNEPGNPIELISPMPKPDSRLVYFKGDFFSDSFYKRTALAENKTIPWSTLLNDQPWLEWSEPQQKYILHTTGASERIAFLLMQSQDTHLTFYRGTTPQEGQFFQLLKKLQSTGPIDIDELKKILKFTNPETKLAKAIQKIISSNPSQLSSTEAFNTLLDVYVESLTATISQGSLFTTTSHFNSQVFQKGLIIEFKMPIKNLQQLVAQKKIYIGIEGKIEMAFIGKDAILELIHSFKTSTTLKVNSNMWSDKTPGLWLRESTCNEALEIKN